MDIRNMPGAGVPLITNQPKPLPPLMVKNEETGEIIMVARVATTMMSDDIIATIAAKAALAVVTELLGALEAAGVVPEGTRQSYLSPVQSEQADNQPGTSKDEGGESTNDGEGASIE